MLIHLLIANILLATLCNGVQIYEVNAIATSNTTVSATWESDVADDEILFKIEVLEGATVKQTKQTGKHELEFGNLEPFVLYTIRVSADDEEDTDTAMTWSNVGAPVRNVAAPSFSTHSITLQWNKPSGSVNRGDIDKYLISWTDSEGNKMDNETKNQTFTMKNLDSFMDYTIDIVTVNHPVLGNGGGPGAPFVTKYKTIPDVGAKIDKLAFSEVECYSFLLTWAVPTKPNGEILQYHIEISDGIGPASTFATPNTSHLFKSLLPSHDYTVSVSVENKQMNDLGGGIGEKTTSVQRTKPKPGGVPRDLIMTARSDVSISISWTAPYASEGVVEKYWITLENSSIAPIEVLAPTTTKKLINLIPYTNYIIKVAAQNSGEAEDPKDLIGEPKTLVAQTTASEGQTPGNVDARVESATSITLTWEEPNPTHGPIDKYLVRMFSQNPIEVPSTEHSYTFTRLTPFTPYNLGVATVNKMEDPAASGIGVFKYVQRDTLPAVGVPVKMLQALAESQTSMRITWEEPDVPYGKIKEYRFRVLGKGYDLSSTISSLEKLPIILTNLTVFTFYTVSVVTVNEAVNGRGGGAGPVEYTIAPTYPGVGLQLDAISFPDTTWNSIKVSWTAPAETNGLIEQYLLEITGPDGTIMNYETKKNSHLLEDLIQSTTYKISVAVENKALNGNGGGVGPARIAEQSTKPKAGGMPQNLSVISKTEFSIEFAWQAPDASEGKVAGYWVSIKEIIAQPQLGPIEEPKSERLPIDKLNHKFENLTPFTEYEIAVATENIGNADQLPDLIGPAAKNVTRTNSSRGQPVRNVKAVANNGTTVTVSWERPEPTLGNIRFYQVSISTALSPFGVPRSVHNKSFFFLTPFTQYRLGVATNNRMEDLDLEATGEYSYTNVTTWPSVGVPVKNLTVTDVSRDSMKIHFEAPDIPLGHVKVYEVNVKGGNDTRDIPVTDLTVLPLLVKDLETFQNYTISVVTVNDALENNGGGPGVPEVIVTQTLPGGSFEPEAPELLAVTANSIFVKWSAPTDLIGIVEKYFLTADIVSAKSAAKNVTIPGTETEGTLEDLESDTKYDLYIQAVILPTIDGLGGGFSDLVFIGQQKTAENKVEEDFFTPGVIAGIVIACVVFVIIVALIIYCCVRTYRRHRVEFI